jgi:excisionase family DNA binding protein
MLGSEIKETDMQNFDTLAVPVAEAARRLSLSPRTVATLIASKELPSLKVGRRRLVTVKALEAFLRNDHAAIAASRGRQDKS